MNIKEIEQQHNRAREWMADKISEYCRENGFKKTCKIKKINDRTLWRVTKKMEVKFDTLLKIFKKIY